MLEVFFRRSSGGRHTLGVTAGEGIIVYMEDNEVELIYKKRKMKITLYGEIRSQHTVSVYIDLCYKKEYNAHGILINIKEQTFNGYRDEIRALIREGEYIKCHGLKIELIDALETDKCI